MNERVGNKAHKISGPHHFNEVFWGIYSFGICQGISAKVKYRLLSLIPHTMKKEA